MDENTLQLFAPEEQTRYKAYEDMFGTDGWKQLVRDLSDRCGFLVNSALTTVTNEKELYFQKGLVQSMLTIINLESGIQAEIDAKVEDAERTREEDEASQGSNA